MKEPLPISIDTSSEISEDEISLLDVWRVIWKRRKFISLFVIAFVFFTITWSLFMKNIYQSKAVIIPVVAKDSGGTGGTLSALASQFGSMPGISLPGSASATEIVSLLDSNILREKVVERYRLMPILFYEQWNSQKKEWIRDQGVISTLRRWLSNLVKAVGPSDPKAAHSNNEEGIPQLWDALRLLDHIVQIDNNVKENTITLTVDYEDPEIAAKLVGYFLDTLTMHMSAEAKRVALINRTYLEQQLQVTADPLLRQKIYALMAQQVETAMMAEVKENFAFKVIDPPKVPDRKIKPKRALMVVLSFFVALFVGVLAAFFMEYLERVRNSSQVKESEKVRGDGQ
ncbi:G-rich domain on putative tyrosine kinase [Syntrophus gentianae]|uniref:G-rich domain on putative tyrosine kinase n=1 Tax=Syntrophus gentianae TaxID=43775 RepID=A0A1H7V764_9BACT|nr:Wzz/FepE/Etk N-terminal domain-containing protein [Syntrophus gentianae]SEM05053.1 G-rich domain on putative tyrosine kinase [Syntrophus gentianae]